MTSLVNVVKGFSYVRVEWMIYVTHASDIWHMQTIISAMAKQSENKEEESGYNDVTVVRKIWTASKRNHNDYQKQTLWPA